MYTASASVPQIYDVGLTLFLQHIVRSSKYPIHTHLIATLLSQLQLERDGETITRSTVRECVDILLRLSSTTADGSQNVYLSDLEPDLLKRSREFYHLEAATLLETGDSALYLRNVSPEDDSGLAIKAEFVGQVERRLAEEADRTAHYLSSYTHQPLQDLLVDELLTPHVQTILDMPGTGLSPMIDADRVTDLHRLYTLFRRVPDTAGRDALRLTLRMDIEERGKAVDEGSTEPEAGPSTDGPGMDVDGDEKDGDKGKTRARNGTSSNAAGALSSAIRWVQDTLELKDKFDSLLLKAFSGDISIQTSINEVRVLTAGESPC